MKTSLQWLSLSLLLLTPQLSPQCARAQEPETPSPARAETAPENAQNDFKLEPGVRAGQLLLGMDSRTVLRIMGKPTELSQRSEGIEEITWRVRDGAETVVILAADAVIQINVDDPRFHDALGNGVSSPLKTIFARYRAKGYAAPKESIFGVEDPQGGGYEAHVYDDIEAGIAFHLGVQDDFDLSAPPDTLMVHRAGKAALPARGAKLVSLAQKAAEKAAQQKAISSAPPRPTVARAYGNGLPLTEIVTDEGARAWGTEPVLLPGRVLVSALAITTGNEGSALWHPLILLRITAVQERAVWQDVSQVTFSFGERRLSLPASKQTTPDNSGGTPMFSTRLIVRFPFRDFLELARAGKFVMSVGGASFPVERAQTVGMRVLARGSGASDVSVGGGSSRSNTPSPSAPVSNRAPVGGANEFFPQTSRRLLRRDEARALSAGDLRLAINEIYARHGLGFKDKELQARFEALGWYRARDERTIAVVEGRLSRIEHANLDLLVAERKRRS